MRATRLLEQLASILQLGNYARFVSQLAQESLRQAYISGKSASLDSLAQRYRLAELLAEGYWDSARPHDECWERYGLACVYWLLGRGAKVRACRLLKVLDESLRHSELTVRRLIIEANLMVAGNSQPDLAAQRLELLRLLDAYGMVNISRSVFDEAPGFGPCLLALSQAGLLDIPEKYRESYAEFFPDERTANRSERNINSLLTDKENEIFAHLLSGLSNSQISAQTGVALSTAKWHLKNIYAKLNVANRTEAILCVQPRTSQN